MRKLPEPERERVRLAYWQALDHATDERKGRKRLTAIDGAGDTAAATRFAGDVAGSSFTCAIRQDTAADGGAPTCSSGRSARSTPHQGDPAVLDLYKSGVRFSQVEGQRLRRMRYAGSEQTTDEELSAA